MARSIRQEISGARGAEKNILLVSPQKSRIPAALIGPYKEAVSRNGPAAAQMKLQMDAGRTQ
jgi:hypothetical protein